MQERLIIVFLVSCLAAAVDHPLKDTVPYVLRPSVDLLLDVLTSMDRALDFMSTQTDLLNLDGVIGLRMVDDQMRVFLDHHGTSLMVNSTARRDLLTGLNDIRWKAKDAVDAAVPKVSVNQPKYFETLGVLLKEGQWALDYPVRSLPSSLLRSSESRKKVRVPFVEEFSDSCVHELTGTSAMTIPPCNISDHCWRMMTGSGYQGYALTHEILYLEIGEMSGCSEQMALLASRFGQNNVSSMQDLFCSQILVGAEDIESAGYPQKYQDLLMEQIVTCGILGYREFLNEDWLKAIMSWQDPIGCYTRPEFEGHRVKREDTRLEGSCSAHKTAVALGAMVASARFLLEVLIDGATMV